MKRAPEGLGPIVSLDRRLVRPLHRQIYDGYRDAILEARLRPGQRLPSTRTLAEELQVSRIPVVTAFEQLAAEGYLMARVGAGSFVAPGLTGPVRSGTGRRPPAVGRPGRRRAPPCPIPPVAEPWLEVDGPFRLSRPALDQFPAATWSRLVARQARRLTRRDLAYGDPMGLPALREALAEHLGTVRSVRCSAAQIMIVTGSQQALVLVARALLAPGDPVWIEEPGYGGARDALRLAGARPVPVPVDGDGLDVEAGIELSSSARAALVTPSHQYPLGVTLSAARRLQLLDWARRCGAWLVEDDYDSEYRFDTRPLASLHGLDGDARVLYVGTFSKVLFPALRVGYLVVPPDLVPRLRRIRDAMDIFTAPFLQAVLAEFIREGHFARHLRRMRKIYGERRRALETALGRELGGTARVVGERAGMHLTVLLPPGSRDRAVALRAARLGLSVHPLSSCYTGRAAQPGLVLGYGGLRPAEISEAVRRLRAALRPDARL
jgi:GntR family transcriptional regulator/MocR family aminotransferase